MVAFRKDGAVVRLQVENARHRLRVLPQGASRPQFAHRTAKSSQMAAMRRMRRLQLFVRWLAHSGRHTSTINDDQSLWDRPRELALFGGAQQSIQVHTWEEGEDGPGEREIAGMVLLHVRQSGASVVGSGHRNKRDALVG